MFKLKSTPQNNVLRNIKKQLQSLKSRTVGIFRSKERVF